MVQLFVPVELLLLTGGAEASNWHLHLPASTRRGSLVFLSYPPRRKNALNLNYTRVVAIPKHNKCFGRTYNLIKIRNRWLIGSLQPTVLYPCDASDPNLYRHLQLLRKHQLIGEGGTALWASFRS